MMPLDEQTYNSILALLKKDEDPSQKGKRRQEQLILLFNHMVEHLAPKRDGSLQCRFTQLQLLEVVLGRTLRQDEPIPANARGAISRLRTLLNLFADSPMGRRLPYRVLVNGPYGLDVLPSNPLIKQFWQPYIRLSDAQHRSVRIMYTEHLFFYRPEKKYIVRHLEVNDEAKDDIYKTIPLAIPMEDRPLVGSHLYVNASDVRALFELASLFSELAIPVEHIDGQAGQHPSSVIGHDLIIIGNPRTSPLAYRLQEQFKLNFPLKGYCIQNLSPEDGEPVEGWESVIRSRKVLFGVVSRAYSEPLKAWVTMILSNHGRFLAAISHYLKSADGVTEIMRVLGVRADEEFRTHFEMVFEVEPPQYEDNKMYGYPTKIVASRVHTGKHKP